MFSMPIIERFNLNNCRGASSPQGSFEFLWSHMNYSDKKAEVMLGTGESDFNAGDGRNMVIETRFLHSFNKYSY